jgi:hypothetical protein
MAPEAHDPTKPTIYSSVRLPSLAPSPNPRALLRSQDGQFAFLTDRDICIVVSTSSTFIPLSRLVPMLTSPSYAFSSDRLPLSPSFLTVSDPATSLLYPHSSRHPRYHPVYLRLDRSAHALCRETAGREGSHQSVGQVLQREGRRAGGRHERGAVGQQMGRGPFRR